MSEALREAAKAFDKGEVPIGTVIVHGGEVIARGHNRKEELQDPTAHAEILAIRDAASKMASWRLIDTTIYVTLEPCPMCAGAMVQARIGRLVYGARDPKAGAAGSIVNLVGSDAFNHRMEVEEGVMREECTEILQRFFAQLREGDKGK
ncbi:MAG: tRNA adenosine(34) deaminase TadA [Firmicutes bacterium]|nr:tRNA adenosine(34) deaminase TadA [Bacillota bacterium]